MVKRSVEIAGAGLAGLTLATALAQRNWQVRVHERAAEPRSEGGGLYLRREGREAARDIGMYSEIEHKIFAPEGVTIRVNGKIQAEVPPDDDTRTILRQELHNALLNAAQRAGAEIVVKSEAVAAEPEGVLVLADGSRIAADLVVAADGVASRIPASLGIEGTTIRYDDGIIRVLLDREGVFGSEGGRTIDLWRYGDRSLRILYSPCGPSHCYLCLMSMADDERGKRVPIDLEYWINAFPEITPLLSRGGCSVRYDRYGMIRRTSWSAGRVALIGDCAHAMPSSLGRSASVGMQNAVALANALSGEVSLTDALAAWEAERRPEVERIQDKTAKTADARSLTRGAIPDVHRIEMEAMH